jgi:TolA-binding protein
LVVVLLAAAIPGPAVAAQDGRNQADRHYNAAVALQNREVYDLAGEQWIKFIDTYPTEPRRDRAFHHLGVCYLKTSKLDLALQSFQAVITSYPKSEMLEATYLYLGLTQYTMGQSGRAEMYDAAATTLETMLGRYPKGKHAPQALFYRAECLYARGKKTEAAQMYSQLVEKYPADRLACDALYALGVSQEEMRDFVSAGKTYDLFVEKFPGSPLVTEVGMRRGETLLAAGDFCAAAARFAAAAAKPGFALADHATIRQAACLAQLKQYEQAAELYASVAAKFPQSPHLDLANLSGGRCYYLAGNYAAACKLLAAVLDSGGESAPEAAHWNARCLLKQRQPAEALAVVEKFLPQAGQGPMTPQLLLDQADAVYEIPQGRGESVALYTAAAEKYPQDPVAPQALYMAGLAALEQGDYAAALRHAEAFLAAYRDHDLAADVSGVAAESDLQLGKPAEAEQLYSRLLEKYPNHADAESWKVRRGLSLRLQKKHRETIAVLQPLLAEIRTPAALAEAQYLIGSSQVELKDFAAAAKSLEASLAAADTWRQADETLLALSQVYSQLNQAEKAEYCLRKLIAAPAGSGLLDRAHYRLGECRFAAGDFPAAAAEYQQVAENWPQSPLAPYALYGLGWAKLNLNDYAGAAQALDSLEAKYADHKLIPRGRYARAVARQQLGKFASALDDVQALLAADPTPAEKSDARYVLGLCQAGLQKHAEAVETFRWLLKDDPQYANHDKVLYELAWALKSIHKEKEAAEAFASLLEKRPDSPLAAESQYHVGEFAYQGGDFQQAAAAYRGALQKAGQSELGEKAAHKLGWAFYRQEDFQNAREAFHSQRQTWPAGPLSSDAAFLEAECLTKLQKFDEALAAYQSVKTPSSKDWQVLALWHGAQAAGQLKRWEKSRSLLSQCAQQFPDSTYLPEILCEQGWAEQNLGNLAEATALYEQVIAKTDRQPAARAQFLIGEIEFQQQKHAEAVKSFFKVSYGYSYPQWQAEATYEAGRCFEVLGKKAQALRQYQELVEKFPQSDKITLAKERIETLKE